MSHTTVGTGRGAVTTRRRLESLTGLRWIAALAVFGFHVQVARLTDSVWLQRALEVVFAAGAAGVPFFFVLSGMVLTWSSRPGTSAATFWRNRVARVVPNHVVTWLGVAALLVVAGNGVGAGPTVVGLVLLQSWVPDAGYYFAVNTPAWSLSCELAFYAAFPLLLPLLRRVPTRRLGVLAVALVVAIWLVPVLSLPMGTGLAYWFVWIFPVTRSLEFALGITVALLVAEGRWRGPGLRLAGALALAAYLTVPLAPERWGWVAWTAGPFALLIGAAAASGSRGDTGTVLGSRPLVWLGTISFAFYLVHFPVVGVAGRLLGDGVSAPVALVTVLAALMGSVLAAWALHRLVEVPAERWIRRPRARR